MSVLACNRHSCQNVMCDRYSDKYGYICYECIEELIETGAETNIQTFMDSPKGCDCSNDGAKERYNAVFPLEEE